MSLSVEAASARPILLSLLDAERDRILAQAIRRSLPQVEHCHMQPTDHARVCWIIGWSISDDLLAKLPGLRLVLSSGAGIDQFVRSDLPDSVGIVRMREGGITAQMVEFATMAVLALHRDLPRYLQQARDGMWREHPNPAAANCRVGIAGLGQLGIAVIDALRPFGFPLSGLSTRPKTIPGVRCHVDRSTFLAEIDMLVCLMPLTPATEGFLGHESFAAMRKGAKLVHLGRGAQLDSAALREALAAGQIASAFLDVTDPEPLPSSHWLWHHPAVIVTPHVACRTRIEDALEQILTTLRDDLAGNAPGGLINRSAGY